MQHGGCHMWSRNCLSFRRTWVYLRSPIFHGKNFMYILTRLTRRMSLVEQEFLIFPVGNIWELVQNLFLFTFHLKYKILKYLPVWSGLFSTHVHRELWQVKCQPLLHCKCEHWPAMLWLPWQVSLVVKPMNRH